ncbi:MAG: hypothetical protein GXP16_12300 [Gammaproteobacteria bacterium]|nr:hypothetical protein [Gammaproteobacteria bacterium]
MQLSRPIAIALLCTLITGCSQSPNTDTHEGNESGKGSSKPGGLPAPSHQSQTEIIEVPVTGIGLGWGYNMYDSAPLPNQCIEFTASEEPAQTRTMNMTEVNDTYEVMKSMGMSAEASVQVMGFNASGKASFAKNLNISGTSTTFVLDASVDNGVRYAGPYVPPEGVAAASSNLQYAIRLTPAAERLARKPEDFLRQCGNGYVSAIYSGARLTAVISIHTKTRSEKQTVSAEVSAGGYGVTVSGAMHAGSASKASSLDRSMSVFLVGGRGDAIPKDQAELEAKLETLSNSAYEAPKDFRMAISPYESLPNWPQNQELRGAVGEFEQLAGLWGDYNSIYDEMELILENPSLFASIEFEDGKFSTVPMVPAIDTVNAAILYLEKLQDYVHQTLRDLEEEARICLSAEENGIDEGVDCSFDESRYLNGYAFRSQLPLRLPVEGQVSRDRMVAERWIIDKSRGRCRFDLLDLGCLSNEEVRYWQSRVGKRLSILQSEDERTKVNMVGLAISEATGAVWTSAEQEQAIIAALQD